MKIESFHDWWKVVEDNQVELLDLVKKFHPACGAPGCKMPISAPLAEKVCACMRKKIRAKSENIVNQFHTLLAAKDKALWHILQDTWWAMPESIAVRREPGFHVLCDLCSESWVFEEGEQGLCN